MNAVTSALKASKPMLARQWSPEMSVGVDVLDHDHNLLMIAIGMLENEIMFGKTQETTQKIVEFLRNYTRHHFAREEMLMEKMGFSGFSEHQQTHSAFTVWLDAMKNGLIYGQDPVFDESVITYLADWIERHVLGMDSFYKPIMIARKDEVRAILDASNIPGMELSF